MKSFDRYLPQPFIVEDMEKIPGENSVMLKVRLRRWWIWQFKLRTACIMFVRILRAPIGKSEDND